MFVTAAPSVLTWFSSVRLVFLSRQTRKTRKFEVRALAATGGRDPDFTYKQPSENKGGVAETFIRVRSDWSKVHWKSEIRSELYLMP